MGTISLSSMKKEDENMSAHKVVRALSRESRVQSPATDTRSNFLNGCERHTIWQEVCMIHLISRFIG